MPIYLYGLILPHNAARVPGQLSGIGDSAIRVIFCAKVAALAGTVTAAPPTTDLAAIRAHDRALRDVASQGITVAAVRFGQTFATDDAMCAQLMARAQETTATLERWDGCVEMRVLLPEESPPQSTDPMEGTAPGRAYLESLRRSNPVPDRSLQAFLGDLVLLERVERVRDARGLAFAHLIRGDAVDRYRAVLAEVPDLSQARVVGPLPLYAFSDTNG